MSSPYLVSRPTSPGWRVTFAARADYLLLIVIFVAATGGFFRFGIASYVWGLVYVTVLAVVIRDSREIFSALSSSWPIFCFPLLCLISVFWSVEPDSSLRHAIQYLFTGMIALWIGSRFSLTDIFSGLCMAMWLCVFASVTGTYLGLIDGHKQDDYVGAVRYFIGLYPQKNVMGVVLLYAAIATLVVGVDKGRKFLFGFLAAFLLPVVIATKSTTALLLYFATGTYYLVLWFSFSVKKKAPVLIGAFVLVLTFLFVSLLADADFIGDTLGLLGKDMTLTGRTVIWSQGLELFLQKPVLGVGYQAFWESPNYQKEVMLVRAAVLESVGGFHSGYVETLVGLGLLGLFLYLLMFMTAFGLVFRACVRHTSALSLGALYVVSLVLGRTFTESAGYFQHDIEFILLIAVAVATQATVYERQEST